MATNPSIDTLLFGLSGFTGESRVLNAVGVNGYIMSSMSGKNFKLAKRLKFTVNGIVNYDSMRYYGLSVRLGSGLRQESGFDYQQQSSYKDSRVESEAE